MFSFHLQTSVFCLTQDCKTHGVGKAPVHCDHYMRLVPFRPKATEITSIELLKNSLIIKTKGNIKLLQLCFLSINVLVIIPQFKPAV